jgi:hypothetical protein
VLQTEHALSDMFVALLADTEHRRRQSARGLYYDRCPKHSRFLPSSNKERITGKARQKDSQQSEALRDCHRKVAFISATLGC